MRVPRLTFHAARARVGATPRHHRARPPGRALERVLRARTGESVAASRHGRVHERHGGGGAVPRGGRGVTGARAALPVDGRPSPAAARHRREPDDRPGAVVRPVRACVPRAARSVRGSRRARVAAGRARGGRSVWRPATRTRARQLLVRGTAGADRRLRRGAPSRSRACVPPGSQPGTARGRRRPRRRGAIRRARRRGRRIELVDGAERGGDTGVAAALAAAGGTDVGAAAARVGARGRSGAARVGAVPRTTPAGGRAADRRHPDDARDPTVRGRRRAARGGRRSSTWTPTRSTVRRGACTPIRIVWRRS